MLRIGIAAVRFLVRFRRLRFTPEPLSLQRTRVNPYSMRMFRKVIDANAFQVATGAKIMGNVRYHCLFRFQIYSHWVKRGEGQNRAALFQHYEKREVTGKGSASAQQQQRQRKKALFQL